jgi:hypothetical protein
MSVVHRLNGYDKRTEVIVFRHDVPNEKLRQAKEYARVPVSDPLAVGSYPVLPNAARKLAWEIGLISIDVDRYDWFLEPTADAASINRKRRTVSA